MRRISIFQSPSTILLRYCAFALARLRGNPALSEEANLLEQAETELLAAVQSDQTTIKNVMASLAVRDTKKYELDVALRSVRLAVLSLVRNNRASRIYRTIFPNGFVDILRSNPLDEINQARNVLRNLVEAQSPALAAVTEGLQVAVDALLVALTDSDAAGRAEADSRVTLLNAKVRFAAQYEDIYRRLTNILGDWRLAETYFRRFPRTKSEPTPAAEPESEPESEPEPEPPAADSAPGPDTNLKPASGTETDPPAEAA